LLRIVVYHRCSDERRYHLRTSLIEFCVSIPARVLLQPISGKAFPTKRSFPACRVSRLRTATEDSFVLTVTDYQNYAAACERLARATATEANKATLLMMAEKWSGLATQAERIRELVKDADAVFDASESQLDLPSERGSDS
jgi:hypothetical protein